MPAAAGMVVVATAVEVTAVADMVAGDTAVVDSTAVAAEDIAAVAACRVAVAAPVFRAAAAEHRAAPSVAEADRSLEEARAVAQTSLREQARRTRRLLGVSEQRADASIAPARSRRVTACTQVTIRTPASTVVGGTAQTPLRSVPGMVA